MNNKKVMIAGVLLLASNVVYAELFSALTLASDNVSRGISDTDGAPAIQGFFDYSHDSGAYAGLWASNVKFRENANVPAVDTVEEASIEIDYYLGYGGDFSDVASWDVGLAYMTYPGADSSLNYEYVEAYGILSYAMDELPLNPEFGVELYHTPDNTEDTGAADYMVASVSLSLPMDIALSFAAGRSSFDDYPADDYTDIRIGLSKEIEGFEFDLYYTDTDLSKTDCGGDMCDSRVAFSITRSM